VTVVIPVRNEAADIGACVRAVLAQEWPPDQLEVIVVDGGSDDTAERAEAVLAAGTSTRWQVLHNPNGTTPSNLNVGLGAARGEYLCRVDARSRIAPSYVSTCVTVLSARPDVSVIGGAQIAVAEHTDPRTIGIARALNNRWTMGGSRYRRGGPSGVSDTVYLGAFRIADLRAVGGWDERLGTNQDYELNRRMAARGVVWFEESLRTGYIPRTTLGDLWRQYVRFGRAKVVYWRLTGDRPQRRQTAVLGAVPIVAVVGMRMLARPALRRRAPLVAGLAMLAIEHEGADEPAGGPIAHLWGAAAMATVGIGWVTGAWQAVLAGPRLRP